MVEHNITWSINNGQKIPEIYVDGEQAQVVSCSYQFVTATDIDESGVSMMLQPSSYYRSATISQFTM
ncbi:hypothetical protein DVV32_15040 [Lactiplantibacillus plantarum]|nr:hypothetical protein DVV32_15040 [Lactiplantibacillus plantarum]